MRKFVIQLLIVMLAITSISFVFANDSNGSYETHYRLDEGVLFIWKNSAGVWQNGAQPGGDLAFSFTINLARNIPAADIYDVNVYPYKSEFEYFDEPEIFFRWKKTYSQTKYDFDRYYYNRASNNIKNIVWDYNNQTGNIQVSYVAKLTPVREVFDVKETLEIPGGEQIIYDYMGYTAETIPSDIKNSLETLKPSSFSSNVEGYMYFVPLIIEYKVKVKPEGNKNPDYIYSGLNNYMMTRHQPAPQSEREYTFWFFRPTDTHFDVEDEFLVQATSWTFQDKEWIERQTFDMRHFIVNEENQYFTYEFVADFIPITAVIWRKGKEQEKYMYNYNWKNNYWAGYEKQYNGDTYYYYGQWDAQADGEFFPDRMLLNYSDEVVNSFIERFGYSTLDEWLSKPWRY